MFGVGGWELLVILLVALLVLGPEKLPGLARTLGRATGEFRRMSTELQRTLNVEAALNETRKERPSAGRASDQDAGRAPDQDAGRAPDQGAGRADQTAGNKPDHDPHQVRDRA